MGTAVDPLDQQAAVVRGVAREHPRGEDHAQGDCPGERVPLRQPQPVERGEGQLDPPDDEGADEDGKTVESVSVWRHARVAVDGTGREDDVQGEEDGEDGCRSQECGDCLPSG